MTDHSIRQLHTHEQLLPAGTSVSYALNMAYDHETFYNKPAMEVDTSTVIATAVSATSATNTTTAALTATSTTLSVYGMQPMTSNSALTNASVASIAPTASMPTNKVTMLAPTAAMTAALLRNNVTTRPAATLPNHYSLRWNNHQNHIMHAFDSLLQTKTLVDVTLVCAETSIRAHKMVLSACSPFFQRVFADTPCKHPVIVLKDFRGWVVQAIIEFMYRGEISVQEEQLQALIQAGESLQIRGLVESSMPNNSPTPAVSPDDLDLMDTSLLASELERCSSFDEEPPSMVTAASKIILPSRLFGASLRRDRARKRYRMHGREFFLDQMLDCEHENPPDSLNSSDACTSPMPRRKQARPRRRSGELPHELCSRSNSPVSLRQLNHDNDGSRHLYHLQHECPFVDTSLQTLKTVIKDELIDALDVEMPNTDKENDEDYIDGKCDSQINYDLNESVGARKLSISNNCTDTSKTHVYQDKISNNHNNGCDGEDFAEVVPTICSQKIGQRRTSIMSLGSDGPEDLCTKKGNNSSTNNTNGNKQYSNDHKDGSNHNNSSNRFNNSNKNNNNCSNNTANHLVLTLKDMRELNKPITSSSTTLSTFLASPLSISTSTSNNLPTSSSSNLRDLHMHHNNLDNQCKMETIEAHVHAAAAVAAAAAAASVENPFQHIEQQMDLSLAAAAAAAAVSHHQCRERDHLLQQREQCDLQQHHNAYTNSLLGQVSSMTSMSTFGPNVSTPQSVTTAAAKSVAEVAHAAHERLEESMNRLAKEFTTSTSPMNLPTQYNSADGSQHPPSPLPFPPGMPSALAMTPPHILELILFAVFGLESTLGLFPPGMDPGKIYNPLLEMSDPRGMPNETPPFLKKKIPRPKGQHSAPRGGPPRSWTNAELTEALQHVWNKKMTTSQASRIFGIPYNSLLMYVRGKYGKSLKLEQLRKDCISGPPLELLQMGVNTSGAGSGSNKNSSECREQRDTRKETQRNANCATSELDLSGNISSSLSQNIPRSSSSESDLLGGPNSLFNPFNSQGFYPDFPSGFPGLPLSMLNLLPPSERSQQAAAAASVIQHNLGVDEDCKSDRSKQSSSMDEDFTSPPHSHQPQQPMSLNHQGEPRHNELMAAATSTAAVATTADTSLPIPVSSSQNQLNGRYED